MLSYQTLFSGSKGNVLLVASEKTKILIDVGVAACHVERALAAVGESCAEIDAIMITHEHGDHVHGAGTISRRYDIPIYAAPKVWQTFSGFGHIRPENQASYDYGMEIGDLCFDFFKTHHDTVQPVGLVVSDGEHKLGVCTDTGCVTPAIVKKLADADGLVFEANHDYDMLRKGPYSPSLKARISGREGHLSNEESAYALLKIIGAHTRHILLAHLSEENNHPELAQSTVDDILAREGARGSITLAVAPARSPSDRIILK